MITRFPFGRVAICKESIVFSIYLVYLWNLCLCRVKPLLPEKVMLQKSQGIDNPSMWLASMWDFISHESPSFPHTLQMYDLCCLGIPLGFLPFGITFCPFFINDFTSWSSTCRSVVEWFGTANAVDFVFRAFSLGFRFCWQTVDVSNNSLWIGWLVDFSSSSIKPLVVCPVIPFSLISSAMERKESKSSWWTFASPK